MHFDGTIGVGGRVDRIGFHLAVSVVLPASFRPVPIAFFAPFVHRLILVGASGEGDRGRGQGFGFRECDSSQQG